jgi:hypothetical protein
MRSEGLIPELRTDAPPQLLALCTWVQTQDVDLATVGRAKPLAAFDGGRFARSVWSDDAEYLVPLDLGDTSATAMTSP